MDRPSEYTDTPYVYATKMFNTIQSLRCDVYAFSGSEEYRAYKDDELVKVALALADEIRDCLGTYTKEEYEIGRIAHDKSRKAFKRAYKVAEQEYREKNQNNTI